MSYRLLIVDDEKDIRKAILNRLEPYTSQLSLMEAENAEAARKQLFHDKKEKRPHAIILDLMMPYGSEETEKILNASNDPNSKDSGRRLLEHIRSREKNETLFEHSPIYVALITARNDNELYKDINTALNGWGKIYRKPFNSSELVNDLLTVLRIESHISNRLLPPDYEPPMNTY